MPHAIAIDSYMPLCHISRTATCCHDMPYATCHMPHATMPHAITPHAANAAAVDALHAITPHAYTLAITLHAITPHVGYYMPRATC
jgi:hypothetical protein